MTASDAEQVRFSPPKVSQLIGQRQTRHKNKQIRIQEHLRSWCTIILRDCLQEIFKHISLLTCLPKQLDTYVACSVSLNVGLYLSGRYLMAQRKTDIV